jgi:DNA-binding MarR family transcriptional regulator
MTSRSVVDSKPINGPSKCVCVNLRRASRTITKIYDKALEPSKLKVTQFSVLVTIMNCGPINVSNLSRLLNLDRTTLVRNLKSSELACYIEDVAGSDPRERLLAISASGRLAVEEALPCWRAVQKQVRSELGPENLEQLAVLLTGLEKLSREMGIDSKG